MSNSILPPRMDGNNRILLIDDKPEIHADFRKVLGRAATASDALDNVMAEFFGPKITADSHSEFELDSAYQGREGLDKVATANAAGFPYAMAFVDVRMPPGWDGIETIKRIWEIDSLIQIVICTAYSDYSWQEIIDKLGKSDRLVVLKKPFDSIEVLQLAHAFTSKWVVTQQARRTVEDLNSLVEERTRALHETNAQLLREMAVREAAQASLKLSEERLSRAFEASPMPVAILRMNDHTCIELNRAFLSATGAQRDMLVGRPLWDAGVAIEVDPRCEIVARLDRGEPVAAQECRFVSSGGQERAALLWIERFELAAGPHLIAVLQDVSEQRELEERLRQSQKLEAIGHLAAGVAHDFNNLLTVVTGHTSLQIAKAGMDPETLWSLKQVQGAGERAAALTRQLLAFSRKQIMEKRVVSLCGVIENVASMLRRLTPEAIELTFHLPPALPPVFADVCNLEQIIVNLVVNARDAMLAAGSITVRAEVAHVTDADVAASSAEARAGEFIRLSVSDTGEGMSRETLTHIFEPFFTTKEVGKGTGMGLATCLGIVQQHDGWIDAESERGRGTTFRIYLPVTDRIAVPEAAPHTLFSRPVDSDVILLVEDDNDVRALAKCVLEDAGYHVLEAADGPEAIAMWQRYPGRIDLLLTDMVMPGGLSGSDVAERFNVDRPESKILFSSGYSIDLFERQIAARTDCNYLAKPYLAHQLTDAVARALGGVGPAREVAVA